MNRHLKKKLNARRARMKATCDPLDPAGKAERLAATRNDDDAFAATYLPHLYRQTAPEFHRDLSAAWGQRDNEIRAFAAPRNHAKTTRGIIHLARAICFAEARRITVVSAAEDQAEALIEPLRISLAENPRIMQDFGALIKKGSAGDFWTVHDVHFDSRGRGQSLRGPRNDLIWCDDLETDQQARDKAQTEKLVDVVLETLYNRLFPGSDGGAGFVITGTILSRKSMLARFLNINAAPDPEYPEITKYSKLWRAIMTDGQGREYALWPERFSLDELAKIRQRIKPRRFNKEYQNDPRDDDSIFQEAWLRGFHPAEFMELAKAA